MSGPTYPNQQLRAVSLEAYFRGRIGYRSAAERIQKNFEDELVHLFVPNAKAGQALDLQPYQLRNEEQTESLAIASNQVAYVSFSYPGQEAFTNRALQLVPPALRELNIAELERVLYHYENEIAIGRDEENILPLDRILKLPTRPWWEGDRLLEISCTWTQRTEHGQLAVRVAVDGHPVKGEILKISVVSGVVPGGTVADLKRTAGLAHDAARRWFEDAITDDFRAYISSEDGDA